MLVGCGTTKYSARSLPIELQAPTLPPSTELNLGQMGGWGVGSSEIGIGDIVSITVFSGNGDERTTPFPARVGPDRTVLVPMIGAVPIAGLEPAAAEQRIAAAGIERGIYRQPCVTLTITEHAVNRITVLGAVAKPGVVELPRGACDLASALAAAGGLSNEAGTKVEVLHQGIASFVADHPAEPLRAGSNGVKLASYDDPKESDSGPALVPGGTNQQRLSPPPELVQQRQAVPDLTRIDLAQAGAAGPDTRRLSDRDVVMVQPRDKRFIHVTGLVQRPNEFELTRDKDIRVLDAIAMAGGTTSVVADKIFVIRQLPNMPAPAVIKISMSRAKVNGEENLRLAAGDLVSVESTPATMMVDTVGKFFRVALGLNGSMAAF